MLRQEMRIGAALVTDVITKTLKDYGQTSLQTLESDSQNLTVPHGAVTSLAMKADELVHHKRDFFVWVVMKRQKEIFHKRKGSRLGVRVEPFKRLSPEQRALVEAEARGYGVFLGVEAEVSLSR